MFFTSFFFKYFLCISFLAAPLHLILGWCVRPRTVWQCGKEQMAVKDKNVTQQNMLRLFCLSVFHSQVTAHVSFFLYFLEENHFLPLCMHVQDKTSE